MARFAAKVLGGPLDGGEIVTDRAPQCGEFKILEQNQNRWSAIYVYDDTTSPQAWVFLKSIPVDPTHATP